MSLSKVSLRGLIIFFYVRPINASSTSSAQSRNGQHGYKISNFGRPSGKVSALPEIAYVFKSCNGFSEQVLVVYCAYRTTGEIVGRLRRPN